MNTDLLITPDEMKQIDEATIASGISGFALMRMAGGAVAARVLDLFPEARRVVVLCGPGNNGGDGYVAASALAGSGIPVQIHALGDTARLAGDAAEACAAWGGEVRRLDDYRPKEGDVVVDALFGAGLAREIDGSPASCLQRVRESGVPVVAVDLPSGVSGLSGHVLGIAIPASETVTFFAKKPGHLLMPGRALCGPVTVVDIGIPARMVGIASGLLRENGPDLWKNDIPRIDGASHKYTRGHLGVFSGPRSGTGAARLAAAAGSAVGAGLVTVASPPDALSVNANHLTSIMVHELDSLAAAGQWASDKRFTAFVLGPGFGVGETARRYVLEVIAPSSARLVLDADGITSFAHDREALFGAFAEPGRLVLTPHAGEFGRLFPDIAQDGELSKVAAARKAAALSNAIVLFKGSDTVVASPDGRAVVNANAPSWLATAGSGDVLSGIIGGLLAQGMATFEAAAAAAWIHGEAACDVGPALTADDLPHAVGTVRALFSPGKQIGDRPSEPFRARAGTSS